MLNIINNFLDESDTSDLSSDDEQEISLNMIGKIYNSRYISLKYLGRGTFSKVWLVYDFKDNIFRALKIFYSEFMDDALHEIKIVKKLDNSLRIINIIDNFKTYYDDKKHFCIVYELYGMSLLEIFNLYQTINNCEYIPYRNLVDIFKKILLSLLEIHNKNIIHYDLKLENILTNIEHKKVEFIKNWFLKKDPQKIHKYFIGFYLPDDYFTFNKEKRIELRNLANNKALEKISEYIDFEEIDNLNITNDHINLQDIEIKITDFGNSDLSDKGTVFRGISQCYKSPENIILNFIDKKSDIWVLGCIFYELITNEFLFIIDGTDESGKNKKHIEYMQILFGKLPKYYEEYKEFKKIEKNTDIINKFKKNYSFQESFSFTDIIKKMLNLNFKERFCVKRCLSHEMFD